MPRIGPAAADEVLRVYRETGSIRAAAARAGVSFGAAKRVIGREQSLPIGNDFTNSPGPDSVVTEEGERDARVEIGTAKPIRTVADAVAHAGIDLTVWRVVRCKITSGETAMKLRAFDPKGKVSAESPTTVPVWWVSLKLERIGRKPERDALDGLFARLEGKAPAFPACPPSAPPSDPHMMVLDLVDCHFGKLAWAPETGENYDLKVADRVYRDAVADLIGRASAFAVDEFLLPLGSDFLHVDNANGSTTAGTPQDVDGRLAKIIEAGEAAVLWAVGEMAARGTVHVRWVPGNHDRILSYCLARTVGAWFRNHPRVKVDCGPSPRKYHRYGATLIGLTHGNEERHATLPGLMAVERPDDWAASRTREWHVGHLHKSKRLEFLSLDTHNGVPVRTLRSLSAADAWHYSKGYVGTQRSAEAYLYNKFGYVGHFVADVRPLSRKGG